MNISNQNMTDNDVKIHLVCDNAFLSLGLGFYLRGHLVSIDNADFIITDRADLYSDIPVCRVGIDFIIPCSAYDIFSQLHDFYTRIQARIAGASNIQNQFSLSLKEVDNYDSGIINRSDLEKLKLLQNNPNISDDIKGILADITNKINKLYKTQRED